MLKSKAESLLKGLGITEPSEIDLEVIAWDNNAKVKLKPLSGCEARILGSGDRGVITINSDSSPERQRFSIAHELGHWMLHRGQTFICRSEDIGSFDSSSKYKENEADNFAANLILPQYLLSERVKPYAKLDFETVIPIAKEFSVSLTATAIRIVEENYFPAMLVYHTPKKRKWFRRSKDVPSRWFPRDQLEIESHAFDILYGKKEDLRKQRLSPASAWFDRREAKNYEVFEHSIRIGDDTLTIIEFHEDEMLEDENYSRTQDMGDLYFR